MRAVRTDVSFARLDKEVLSRWTEGNVPLRSMAKDAPVFDTLAGRSTHRDRPSYVFFDGPPFATGLPHYGHLLIGVIKDVVGRFFTMKGYHVDRRFGWDCHGVPVEFEVQKRLNLHGARAIREYGVAKFNDECQKIVTRYTREWRQFVERSGRWVDFGREYRTMDRDYMESVWWVFKQLWDRGLIRQGRKCVAYSWAMNTALSNFEANLNYRPTQDPAIVVRFPFVAESRAKLVSMIPAIGNLPLSTFVWTTTPWTIPSNTAAAVNPRMGYSIVVSPDRSEAVVLASARVQEVFPPESGDAELLGEISGSTLVGLSYEPPFDFFAAAREQGAFKIFPGDFVTADDGTGIVHLASFGEDDLNVFQENGLPIIDPVDEDGRFTDEMGELSGLQVKSADSKVITLLRERGRLVSHKTIEHPYPFCYRTDTPLIYKSIPTWFLNVEELRKQLIANNLETTWVPGHVREGRFGKWIENARDWALSRNRFWGAPIPVWRCSSCKTDECVGSVGELAAHAKLADPAQVKDLHLQHVDPISWPCPQCGGAMKRVPEILDCWFESGSIPYAQNHYPFENQEVFEQNFPADFIVEGLDQTRGWFYTLLVISTALFDKPAFKNVVVNGTILAEDGRKMSKSLNNYPPPEEVLDDCGADALRLYLLSSAATRGEDLRFSKQGVLQVLRQTLIPLWNAYNFLVTYALVDGWTPSPQSSEPSANMLDRWILSRLATLRDEVDSALSHYELSEAVPGVISFIDQLTNWYIRLNRRRFWQGSVDSEDKEHAYRTLHRVLVGVARIMAPMTPFITEEMFQNLTEGLFREQCESIHFASFPTADEFHDVEINEGLAHAMTVFEEVIVLGRTVRNKEGLKVRQPLASLTVYYPEPETLELLKQFEEYIRDELNVKAIKYVTTEDEVVIKSAKLNTKALGKVLGPKLGSQGMAKLQSMVSTLGETELRLLERGGAVHYEDLSLTADDILISRALRPGVKHAGTSGKVTVVLDTALSQELRIEGLAREFVNRVQKLRKDLGFEVTDRVMIRVMTACPRLQLALTEFKDYIMLETLAVELEDVKDENSLIPGGTSAHLPSAQDIDGKAVIIAVTRRQA